MNSTKEKPTYQKAWVTPFQATPENIRTVRQSLGLSQESFAHDIGVTFSTVNRWEMGHSVPLPQSQRVLHKLWKTIVKKREKKDHVEAEG